METVLCLTHKPEDDVQAKQLIVTCHCTDYDLRWLEALAPAPHMGLRAWKGLRSHSPNKGIVLNTGSGSSSEGWERTQKDSLSEVRQPLLDHQDHIQSNNPLSMYCNIRMACSHPSSSWTSREPWQTNPRHFFFLVWVLSFGLHWTLHNFYGL